MVLWLFNGKGEVVSLVDFVVGFWVAWSSRGFFVDGRENGGVN